MTIAFTLDTTRPSTKGKPLTVGELVDLLRSFDRKFTVALQGDSGDCQFAKSLMLGEAKIDGNATYGIVIRTKSG